MDKPRIFLGSSSMQEKLLHALTHGLEDIAHVDPWTTSFNPGTTALERLLELTQQLRCGRLRHVRGVRGMKHGPMLIEMDQQLKLTGLES